jgi:hypothetical protein
MKLTHLLIVHAIVALVFGIGAVLIPQQFLSYFGPTLDPAGSLMMQFGGAWLIGIGLLAWFIRNTAESEARTGIVLSFLTMSVITFVVALLGQIATVPVLNTLGWLPVVISLILALGYVYFLFAGHEEVQAGSLTQHPQH